MNLTATLHLNTAARYANPGNPADILPLVVGDFLSPEANTVTPAVEGPATSVGGSSPAVLVDRFLLIYVYNDGPSVNESPEVYVGNVRQPEAVFDELGNLLTGVWLYHPNVDLEFTGHRVSIIQWLIPPGDQVSVRCKGLVDGAGVAINNPISGIVYVFTLYGNWILDDFDAGFINKATEDCTTLSFTLHWVFDELRTYEEWLTEILAHCLGDAALTAAGRLAILIDPQQQIPAELLIDDFDALDCDGADPEDNPEVIADVDNLHTVLDFRLQYSWAARDYLMAHTTRLEALIPHYGERTKALDLPGIRTAVHLNNWAILYTLRMTGLPTVVMSRVPMTLTFSVPSARYMAYQPSMYLTFTWRYGPHPTGAGWVRRIVKILRTRLEVQPGEQRTVFECLDTGLSAATATALVMEDQAGETWYLFVDDDGSLAVTLTNPAPATVNPGVPLWWVERDSPDSTTHYLYPDGAGGIAVETSPPGTGSGSAITLALVDRLSRRWDLTVTDPPASELIPIQVG